MREEVNEGGGERVRCWRIMRVKVHGGKEERG